MTVREVYEKASELQMIDRLRLAALILNDVAAQPIDESDEWTEEDFRDFSAAGRAHIERMLAEEDRNAETR